MRTVTFNEESGAGGEPVEGKQHSRPRGNAVAGEFKNARGAAGNYIYYIVRCRGADAEMFIGRINIKYRCAAVSVKPLKCGR